MTGVAERRRAYLAAYYIRKRNEAKGVVDGAFVCPNCGVPRQTEETRRVHVALVHQ